MPKIPKFRNSEGPGAPLNIIFQDLHQLFFHEMPQLEQVRLKAIKSQSNMDHLDVYL